MRTAHAGWWRLDYAVQRPTSNGSGGHGTVATEVRWSTRPLPHLVRLLEPKAVGCP
jgi:hypothetical protein